MKKNNKFMLKLWIPIIILLALIVINLVNLFHSDNSSLKTQELFGVLVVALIFVYKYQTRKNHFNSLKKALRNNTPEQLINTLVNSLKKISNKTIRESYTAYNTSLSYVLYGEYDKALDVMGSIDWSKKEPMFQALEFNIKSLINYFRGDIQTGITESRRAKAVATTSGFPGAKNNLEAYEAYIEVGQVLSGFHNNQIIQSLEIKYTKLPILPKLIIAWGLMNVYNHRNEKTKYKNMLEFCEHNAPYCKNIATTKDLKVI